MEGLDRKPRPDTIGALHENSIAGRCLRWNFYPLLVVILLGFVSTNPAFGLNRRVIELQVRLQDMNDEAMIMQQSIDENFAALTQSLKQTSARLDTSREKLATLQHALQAKDRMGSVPSRTKQMATLAQSSVELGNRLQQIEHQVQTLSAEIEPPHQAGVAVGEAPPPAILYHSAMEDYETGHYQLAGQEFAQYVKYYSSTDRAALAQFYLADGEYWAGDYQNAVRDFGKLERQYPTTKAATVALKRGLCMLKLGQTNAAKNELLHILERYPNSVEAQDARSTLCRLGRKADLASPEAKRMDVGTTMVAEIGGRQARDR